MALVSNKVDLIVIVLCILCSAIIFSYYRLTASSISLCKDLEDPSQSPVVGTTQLVKTNMKLDRHHFLLVVLVLSRPSGQERRDSIRQTWMKRDDKAAHRVLVKFSIGTEGISTPDMDKLALEESTYGDLLLLPHLKDSYTTLTRKVLESFVALNNFFSFSYLLKCDDDTYVVLDTILSELAQRESKRSYFWGKMFQSNPILRHGKWAEKNWFLCETYIPYASGGGYVLSQDLVSYITSNSDAIVLYHNEDVSVGVWISPYAVERRCDPRFNVLDLVCNSSNIVIHYQTVKDMALRQSSYNKYGTIC